MVYEPSKEKRTIAIRLMPGHAWKDLDAVEHRAEWVLDDTHAGQLVRYYTGTNSQLASVYRSAMQLPRNVIDKMGYLREPLKRMV